MQLYFPLNSIVWATGSLAVGTFGIKNYIRYRQTHNYLNSSLAWFGVTLAVGLALTSYAEFFTRDLVILHGFNLISEIFISAAFVIKSRLLWHLVLKNRIPYWFIFLPVLAIAVWGWLSNVQGSTTSLSEMFVDFRYASGGVISQNVLLIGVVAPIGITFLVKGFNELRRNRHFRPFMKPFFIGLAYIGIAASTIGRNLESSGLETPSSAYFNTFMFLMLLIVLLLPPIRKVKK